jgi:hypothetical protein
MYHVFKLAPLPLLAGLFIACSGEVDADPVGPDPAVSSDPTQPVDGEVSLALEPEDGSVVDKGRRGHGERRYHGRRHHHRRWWRHHPPRPRPEPQPEPPAESCEVAGQTFADGDAVPSGDSCNSCSCSDGSVNCTLVACEPVFCAAFVENPDGVCSRFPLDPCISQDPDCVPTGGACEVAGEVFPDGSEVPSGDECNTCTCTDGNVGCTRAICGPSICALFIEVPDGICSRFPLDPCISQDPDCSPSPDAGACEVAGQTFPSGSEVPSGDSCNSCSCNEGNVSCTLALCAPVACDDLLETSDGVCSRFPLDPCQFQDPDCVDPDQPVEPTDPIGPEQP